MKKEGQLRIAKINKFTLRQSTSPKFPLKIKVVSKFDGFAITIAKVTKTAPQLIPQAKVSPPVCSPVPTTSQIKTGTDSE